MLNKNIIDYKDFGYILVKLDDIMTERDISTYELSVKTGIRFQTIQKLREKGVTTRVNLDVLAKICYVLECKIEDILEYVGA